MSSQQVTQLRKEGKINEAFELAKTLLQTEPDNIWNRRAMAWVYYEMLKKDIKLAGNDTFIEKLNAIKQLKLPADENVFYKNIIWPLAQTINNNAFDNNSLKQIFEIIKDFHFVKPDTGYTFLLKSFIKHLNNRDDLIDFVKWWGLNNFRKEDYEQTKLENGKKILSDVERIYISVSKILLQNPVDNNKIEWFLPYIAQICDNYPQMQYPHYYHAKLLLASGNKERFLDAFVPFARKKKNDFWVWDLMSDVFDKDNPLYFACLCRSLACKSPVKYNLNVKEKFAALLIKKNMLPEAKYEIEQIVDCRKKQDWQLSAQLTEWLKNEKLSKTKPVTSNINLYKKYAPKADWVLYFNIKPEIIVVEQVSKKNKIIRFVADNNKYGSFLYRNFDINPQKGDIYTVRFLDNSKSKDANFYKIATIEPSDSLPPDNIYKIIEGTVVIHKGNSFGFINNIFIEPEIITKEKLTDKQTVKAFAVRTYNKKKKEWLFKVLKILDKNTV